MDKRQKMLLNDLESCMARIDDIQEGLLKLTKGDAAVAALAEALVSEGMTKGVLLHRLEMNEAEAMNSIYRTLWLVDTGKETEHRAGS